MSAVKPARTVRRPWGGSRLTTFLCALAFVAVANTMSGGVRLLSSGRAESHSLRTVLTLGAAVLLAGWALARVRVQWAQDTRSGWIARRPE